MAQSDMNFTCTQKWWAVAIAGGVVVALLFRIFGILGWSGAIILGIIVCLGAGYFLTQRHCGSALGHSATGPSASGPSGAGRRQPSGGTGTPAAASPAAPSPATATPSAATTSVPKVAATPAAPVAAAAPPQQTEMPAAASAPVAKSAPEPASAAAATATATASAAEAADASPSRQSGTTSGAGTADDGSVPAAPAPTDAPAMEPAMAAPTGGVTKPEFLTAARDGGPDNLKEIKGVGPKLEKTLNRMGVYHFDQIAGWGPDELAWVDDNLEGFKGRASRDDWVSQSKVLAAGGDTEFSKKVGKGGVY